MGDEEYLLGENDIELSRLGFQHEVWARATSALWDEAGFGVGDALVDLGCGPGFASLPLARRVREGGSVLSVDASQKSIATLQAAAKALGVRNLHPKHASVDTIEMGENTLDGAFARWLFCFLREPEELVRKIARALKPGGRVAVMDYFQYQTFALAPPIEVMPRVIDAVVQSWHSSGGDLDIGGKLPAMFEAEGLTITSLKPIVHCARPGTALWEWPRTFFESYIDVLVGKGALSSADAEMFQSALREHAATPGAFMLTPPVMAIVAQKA
ncbi:MAG: methyltransferase domain-containing protein [Polyangiales bacterium]